MLRFLGQFQADFQLKSGWIRPLRVGGHAPFSPDNNETVSFYALDGKALGTAKSIDGNVLFSAKQGTIVVARIGKESVKIAVK